MQSFEYAILATDVVLWYGGVVMPAVATVISQALRQYVSQDLSTLKKFIGAQLLLLLL